MRDGDNVDQPLPAVNVVDGDGPKFSGKSFEFSVGALGERARIA
jgi:hypothetical protein